ncbi:MAG TPA: nuclear transport factor 2 family protein [Solirubrobacterales bacterium]|jgi:hypothetical protein
MEDPRLVRVREMADAWNAADFERFFGFLADDIGVDPDPLWPEPGPYYGEEARDFLRGWIDAWDSVRIQTDKIQLVGRCVVIWGAWLGEGAASHADVELGVAMAIEFDERLRATAMHVRFEHDQALEIARATAG